MNNNNLNNGLVRHLTLKLSRYIELTNLTTYYTKREQKKKKETIKFICKT